MSPNSTGSGGRGYLVGGLELVYFIAALEIAIIAPSASARSETASSFATNTFPS